MPRETIIRGATVLGTEIPGGYTFEPFTGQSVGENQKLFTDPTVDAAWDRDNEYVQLGFELTADKWIAIADMLREHPEIAKHAEYTAIVTRKELNATIRILKRARDAAYGADE